MVENLDHINYKGLGAGFVPDTLNTNIYDSIIKVGNETAMETSRRVAKEEGILAGISSGAAIYAAIEKAKELGKGKTVVTVLPSNGERYYLHHYIHSMTNDDIS